MSKQTIAIHLPDGSVREVPSGTTPLDIANSISPRLAAASVVARLTPLAGAVNPFDNKKLSHIIYFIQYKCNNHEAKMEICGRIIRNDMTNPS